jgi:hypothetical protein
MNFTTDKGRCGYKYGLGGFATRGTRRFVYDLINYTRFETSYTILLYSTKPAGRMFGFNVATNARRALSAMAFFEVR